MRDDRANSGQKVQQIETRLDENDEKVKIVVAKLESLEGEKGKEDTETMNKVEN